MAVCAYLRHLNDVRGAVTVDSIVVVGRGSGHLHVKVQPDEADVVGFALEDELAGLGCGGCPGVIRVLDVGAVSSHSAAAAGEHNLAADSKA